MKAKNCEASLTVICDDEHSVYFACTRTDRHAVHESEWTTYANNYPPSPAYVVLRWKDGP